MERIFELKKSLSALWDKLQTLKMRNIVKLYVHFKHMSNVR
jgi:hypothetical protein